MESRKAALPLSRDLIICAVTVLWALTLVTSASAQYPTDLSTCLTRSGPTCRNLGGGLVLGLCSFDPPTSRLFERFYGRAAWYPLRCVGPITVAVETISPVNTRFPLYVEVVPLEGTGDYHVCEDLPGNVVLIIYGHYNEPCGTWDETGPVDITSVVPLGSLYAIRLYSFGSSVGYSPAVDCIRVTAHPVETTHVAQTTWGLVKALYK